MCYKWFLEIKDWENSNLLLFLEQDWVSGAVYSFFFPLCPLLMDGVEVDRQIVRSIK